MTNFSFNRRVFYTASVVGLMSSLAAHPLSAQGVGDIVRGLNAVINPGDAQRLEDQARRNNQPAEERYWRDYRTGLETPDRSVIPTPVATMAILGLTRTTPAPSAPTRRLTSKSDTSAVTNSADI